jgi:hypothetical protein
MLVESQMCIRSAIFEANTKTIYLFKLVCIAMKIAEYILESMLTDIEYQAMHLYELFSDL